MQAKLHKRCCQQIAAKDLLPLRQLLKANKAVSAQTTRDIEGAKPVQGKHFFVLFFLYISPFCSRE